MPSMHVGWALLIAFNARGTWARLGFSLFALVTCLATVGSGEHYAIDAVVALPFAVAVQVLYRACRRQKPRSRREDSGSGRKIERSGPVSSDCLLPIAYCLPADDGPSANISCCRRAMAL